MAQRNTRSACRSSTTQTAQEHPALIDAVGVPHPMQHQALIVFAVLRGDAAADDDRWEEIRQSGGWELSRALLLDSVRFVTDMPCTRNEKLLRRLLRAGYLDKEPGNMSLFANPDALRAMRESM